MNVPGTTRTIHPAGDDAPGPVSHECSHPPLPLPARGPRRCWYCDRDIRPIDEPMSAGGTVQWWADSDGVTICHSRGPHGPFLIHRPAGA